MVGRPRRGRRWVAGASAAALVALAAGCTGVQSPSEHAGVVDAIGAENEYADVISQIGGRYVHVSAVEKNPNTDPHSFEASPAVAREVAGAQLVVQNGAGYDSFMNRIESADPGSGRRVIDVATLLRLPATTANPHLWYAPQTMPRVAAEVAHDLGALQPDHAGYFAGRLSAFDASLKPWRAAIAALRGAYAGAPVATTEPVGDFLLQATGLRDLTPFPLQANIMNGVDLSPQQVAYQDGLLTGHKVRVLVYNQQVVDSVTQAFLAAAQRNGIPVVGVYETMPAPGYDYQSWMLAEVTALHRALATGASTQRL